MAKKPDASTERGAGGSSPKPTKKRKPDASTERGTGGQNPKVAKAPSGGWKYPNDQRVIAKGKGSGFRKKIKTPTTDPATGETEEQKKKREADEAAAAQIEEDAARARNQMDFYLRNAWPDAADREALLGLITGAVRDKRLYVSGDSQIFVDQVWALIETTSQYAARFPGLVARKATSANGQVPMTPEQYMKMEDMFDAALSTYMIPPGVMDRRTAIAKMVENDVTVEEMQTRIDLAATAATQDESFLKKFSEYRGMTPGHLIAFYLDPDLTAEKIKQQERVFTVGAMMDRYGFAGAKSDAQVFADAGMSDTGVMSSLDEAAKRRSLMGGFGATVTESQLLQGTAQEGTAADTVAKVQAQRAGRFNRTGGAAESNKGVTGLGVSAAT